MAKERAPALSNSTTRASLGDDLGSRLIQALEEYLLYTQGVRG